jgi:integrase
MASVFKRGRWVDADGHKCAKDAPRAKWVESRYYTIAYMVNGRRRRAKGYTDRAASEQLAARLEKAKAQGAEGLTDIYKAHRGRPLLEHVADWVAELRQLGRDDVYIGLCEFRMGRLIADCGWGTLEAIAPERFICWRQIATVVVGHSAKGGGSAKPMGARTQNHYLTTAITFCHWAVKRKRMALNPMTDVESVETAGQLRRQRRSLTEDEITALLAVVPARHQLAYRIILSTGLRRNELRQLNWGDVKLNAPLPCIQLRAETTKAKRADALPLRADLAALLKEHRGDASDDGHVCRTLPSMTSHKGYLKKAGIEYVDDRGRRVDFHALRHTYGSLLAKAGIAPRVAMSLMRHTDLRLTMNVYTDPRIFDLAGAVEKLPAIAPMERAVAMAAGTDNTNGSNGAGEKSVTTSSAPIGGCLAPTGKTGVTIDRALTLVTDRDRQQKTPSGMDGVIKRAKGVEPSTFTLATKMTRTPKKFMPNDLQFQVTLRAAPAQRIARTPGMTPTWKQ